MAAVASGAKTVVGVDPLASRREVATALGATLTLAPSADLETAVLDHWAAWRRQREQVGWCVCVCVCEQAVELVAMGWPCWRKREREREGDEDWWRRCELIWAWP